MATHVKADDCKLYALGVLDGEEKNAVSAHLRTCADCATNIAWAHQMIALVGFASIPALPRPTVKEKILRRIRAESAEPWNGPKPDLSLEAEPETQSQPQAPQPQADMPELSAGIAAAPEVQYQPDVRHALPDPPAPQGSIEVEQETQSQFDEQPSPQDPQVAHADVEVEQEAPSQPDEQPSSPDPPAPQAAVEAEQETESQPDEQPSSANAPEPDLRLEPGPEIQAKPDQPSPSLTEQESQLEEEQPSPRREPLSYRRESETESASSGRVLLILAGLAVLALAGTAARFWQQDRAHQRQADQLQAAVANARLALQNLDARPKSPEPQDEVRVLAAPGTVHIVLTGAAGHGGVLYNTHDGTVVCSALLPAPPPGTEYRLWAFSWVGVPVNVGALSRSEPGFLTAHVRTGAWESRFVVTAEPETGTPSPSGTRLLTGGIDE